MKLIWLQLLEITQRWKMSSSRIGCSQSSICTRVRRSVQGQFVKMAAAGAVLFTPDHPRRPSGASAAGKATLKGIDVYPFLIGMMLLVKLARAAKVVQFMGIPAAATGAPKCFERRAKVRATSRRRIHREGRPRVACRRHRPPDLRPVVPPRSLLASPGRYRPQTPPW